MIRLGIVGCNYGRTVLLPAFRLDPRCEVVAIGGSNAARATEVARQAGIPQGFGDWAQLVASEAVDAIAIATPPRLQPEIAIRALKLGKPLFVEKPMAADLAGAVAMLRAAGDTPAMIDFTFTQLPTWQRAKALLDGGAIGRLRHVVVTWNLENYATRMRLKHWKTSGADGGGALGNLASHSMHYFEWLCGPITGLSARLSDLPDDPSFETGITMALKFASGAAGSFALNCASYLGSGHRLEFYGEDGAVVLANPTADYMRGFVLSHGRRPADALAPIEVANDPVDAKFPAEARIAPVSRLAKRFLDTVEQRRPATPGFAEGYRAQLLLDAVRRSDASGRFVDIAGGAQP